MLAASGDQTVSLWDTGIAAQIGTFAGHAGSVKALSPLPGSGNVFASGARDGRLQVWDARVSGSGQAGSPPVVVVHVRSRRLVVCWGRQGAMRRGARGEWNCLPGVSGAAEPVGMALKAWA